MIFPGLEEVLSELTSKLLHLIYAIQQNTLYHYDEMGGKSRHLMENINHK